MEKKDEQGMDEIVVELREKKSFGTSSPLYKYCDAARRLYRFNRDRQGATTPLTSDDLRVLAGIRKEVDDAIAARGEWSALWRLRGEVDRLQGNLNSAISNYQRSLDFSRANQSDTARRLVTLLYAAGRYSEANQAMEYMGKAEVPDEMRKLVEVTKFKGGDPKKAVEMARKDAEEEPTNPSNQVLLGQMLETVGETAEAEQAYRKATEVGPKLGATWELLVRRQMANGDNQGAKASVEEAAKALSDAPLSLARLYQRIGETEQAEKLYLEAVAEKPDDFLVLQHLADFYLTQNKTEEAEVPRPNPRKGTELVGPQGAGTGRVGSDAQGQ